jgi:hypothetical protein
MKIEALHVGMKVEHPHYGTGTVRAIAENAVTIQFHDTARTVSPETSGIEPLLDEAPAPAAFGIPLSDLVGKAVLKTLAALGVEPPEAVVEGLAARWDGGRMTLVPENPANQAKEVPLEVFFHKIVMMRNNLRVLEQKINAHEKLTDADKVELQQYISKCYGSMTTFNILFREKADGFESR